MVRVCRPELHVSASPSARFVLCREGQWDVRGDCFGVLVPRGVPAGGQREDHLCPAQ